jgi:hypothetical protein
MLRQAGLTRAVTYSLDGRLLAVARLTALR